MNNFYLLQAQMAHLVTGDMAQETLALAEDEWHRMSRTEQIELEQLLSTEKPSEILHSGYTSIKGKIYQMFNGSEVNGVWNKGDFYYDSTGNFKQVPDCWHLEDLRQSDTIYRP